MDSGDVLKKHIVAWAKRIGSRQAQIELIGAGLGLSTVQKLISGAYESSPKGIAHILESVLVKEERDEKKQRAK